MPVAGPSTRVIEMIPDGARDVLIFANPFSGHGPNRKWVDGLVESLCAARVRPRVVWDRAERKAALADEALGRTCRCVVSAGGDGSLADVINEMRADVPIATLPMGNENLFAVHFGFDRRGRRLADAVARGRTRRIDLGVIEREGQPARVFTLMAGIGFDAEVVHRLDRWRAGAGGQRHDDPALRQASETGVEAGISGETSGESSGVTSGGGLRRVNRASYVPRILGALRHYPYAPVALEAEGQLIVGAHAFVFNLPCYGMDLGIAPDASGDSGRLHWVVFEKPGMMHLTRYGIRALLRNHYRARDVYHGSATRVTLSAETTVPVQADGDPVGSTPLTVAVRPAALRVIDMW